MQLSGITVPLTDDRKCFGVVVWDDRWCRRRAEVNTQTAVSSCIYTKPHKTASRMTSAVI